MEDVKTPEDDILFLFFFLFFFFANLENSTPEKRLLPKSNEMEWQRWSAKQRGLPPLSDVFAAVAVVQAVNDVNFVLTTSLHNQEESIKWSLKAKCFDLLSKSLN